MNYKDGQFENVSTDPNENMRIGEYGRMFFTGPDGIEYVVRKSGA